MGGSVQGWSATTRELRLCGPSHGDRTPGRLGAASAGAALGMGQCEHEGHERPRAESVRAGRVSQKVVSLTVREKGLCKQGMTLFAVASGSVRCLPSGGGDVWIIKYPLTGCRSLNRE